MMFDVRPGEAVVISERRVVVPTSKREADGRPWFIGLEANVPTIVPAELGGADAALEVARTPDVRIVEADRAELPVVFAPADASERIRWLRADILGEWVERLP